MSSSITTINVNDHVQKNLTEIFGKDPGVEIAAGDHRLKVFTNFLDNLIQNGYNNGEKQVSVSAGEALRAVDMGFAKVEISEALKNVLNERKDAHLSGARQHISNELLAHLGAVNTVANTLNSVAKSDTPASEGYKKPISGEVENIFYKGLQGIYDEVKTLEKEERSGTFKLGVESLAQEINKTYGSKALNNLSSKIKDSSAVSFAFAKSSSHGLKELPPIIDTEKLPEEQKVEIELLMEDFAKGNYSALSPDEKTEVLDFISSISEAEGKMTVEMDLKQGALNLKQKAYYEHLRKEASEISNHGSLIEDLLTKLTEKVPELIMPAIIGAVVGYLMGGMEVVGVLGAGALSLIGSSDMTGESDQETTKTKIVPPQFTSESTKRKISTVETQLSV